MSHGGTAMDKATIRKILADFPDVAAQWHPTKNGGLTPDQIVAGSNKKCWWQCPEGPDHEWEARVANRTSGYGCPFCAGRRVSITNSIAALHPGIAAQWHPTKNGDLTPDQVVAGSSLTKYWWQCPEGPDHVWEANASNRRSGKGCPFCHGLKVSVTNSLASLHPDIAAQRQVSLQLRPHPSEKKKNPVRRTGGIRLEQIIPESGRTDTRLGRPARSCRRIRTEHPVTSLRIAWR